MPSIETFKESLEKFGVEERVIAQINEGCEDITNKAPKKKRALYFKRAVDIMTEQLEEEKLQEISGITMRLCWA